jgi:hypothetical protein
MELRLADPLVGLSMVADLGFGLPPGEAVRSGALATGLARLLDLPEQEVRAVYYTALLQHVGCVGYAHETAAVFGDELAMNLAAARTNFASPRDLFTTFLPELTRGRSPMARVGLTVAALRGGSRFGARFVTATCEVGRVTAGRLGLGEAVQDALYHVYEWWNGGGAPGRLAGGDIPLPARVARLAGVAALFDSIGGAELAVAAVTSRAGGLLDPELADRFIRAAPVLLGELNAGDARELVLDTEPVPHLMISDGQLVAAAAAFGDLADLKSPFTHGHSAGVANLAEAAGGRLGLPVGDLRRLQLAALLHDLGRVAVSTAVWETTAAVGQRRVGTGPAAPVLLRADPGRLAGAATGGRVGGQTPRTARRDRLPPGVRRGRPADAGAGADRRRRLPGHDPTPAAPACPHPRAGRRAAAPAGPRRCVRPAGGRGGTGRGRAVPGEAAPQLAGRAQ